MRAGCCAKQPESRCKSLLKRRLRPALPLMPELARAHAASLWSPQVPRQHAQQPPSLTHDQHPHRLQLAHAHAGHQQRQRRKQEGIGAAEGHRAVVKVVC